MGKPAGDKNKAVFGLGNVSDARNKAVSATENVSVGSTALLVSNLQEMVLFNHVPEVMLRFTSIQELCQAI